MAKPGFNLIIDSCCDLPYELVDFEGVEVIHFPYMIDGESFSDDMYTVTKANDFYDDMRNGKQPSTAQVPLPVFQDVFRRAAQSGIPHIYLSFTSGLSGSYDTACLMCENMKSEYPDAKLYVVDTQLASIAEGMFVYEAIRQRDKGLTYEEMIEWAEEARYFINELFMVDDLDSLRRGGRIPASVAFAGAKLDVKPMLNIDADGALSLTGVARGRKKGIKQLVECFEKNRDQGDGINVVIIGGADCPKDLERLKDALIKVDDTVRVVEASIGPVIGSHVGPGMLAISFWGQDIRDSLSVADRIARKIKKDK